MPHPPNIPLTRQTDDRNFPQHDPAAPWGQSGHPYPKRINREFMPEDVEPWKKSHVQYDAQSRMEYYYDRCPQPQRVLASGKVIKGQLVPVVVTQEMIDYLQLTQSVGEDLVVNNAEEEAKAKGFLGQEEESAPASVTALVQKDKTESEVERLKRQNAELEAELERNVQLTRKIKAEQLERNALKIEAEAEAEARATVKEEVHIGGQDPVPLAEAVETDVQYVGTRAQDSMPPKKKGGRPKGSRNKQHKRVVQSLTDIGRYDVSD